MYPRTTPAALRVDEFEQPFERTGSGMEFRSKFRPERSPL